MFRTALLFLFCSFAALAAAAEIQWYQGKLPAALAEAAKRGKPVLVYWGAVWCPPCNALKAGAFKDPKFVQATRDFIAVYLDGDTPDAQAWGEKLKATGYPTLMVLNAKGEEVKRLVPHAAVADLTAALQSAALDGASSDELVRRATAAHGSLSPEQWRRLAQADWFNNPDAEDQPERLALTLSTLVAKAPATAPDAQISLSIFSLEADVQALKPPAKLSADRREEGRKLLRQLLGDPALLSRHAMELAFSVGDLTKAIFPDKEADEVPRMRMALELRTAYARVRKERKASLVERDYLLYPEIELSHGADEQFPALTAAEAKQIKASLLEELRSAHDEHELAAVLNTAAFAFPALGAVDEAKDLLTRNLGRLKAQNEAYSNLADLEAQEGRFEQALKDSAKAYEVSSGPATRLQWGASYLRDLVRYAPEREKEIQNLALRVADEGLRAPDAFRGRSYRSLKKLAKNYSSWAKERQKSFPPERLEAFESEFCRALDPITRERCSGFLASLKMGN